MFIPFLLCSHLRAPVDVIASATSTGIKAFKIENIFGTIRVGLKADIISVEGDPEKDISELRKVKFCMKDGKIIFN